MRKEKTTQDRVAEKIGTDSQSINRWKKRAHYPDAQQAVVIARALGVGWHPPEKLKPLVDDLEILDDTRFASAKDMVHGLAELARQERMAHSKQHGQADTAG